MPALRLLIALCAGILLQYHLKIQLPVLLIAAAFAFIVIVLFQFLSSSLRYKFAFLKGLCVTLLFIAVGGCLSFTKNNVNNNVWLGKYFEQGKPVIATLRDNLVIKEKSYKTIATVNAVYINKKWQNVDGDILLYFKKDSTIPNIKYGSQILVTKNLNSIINSGNPGGFNYAEYCSFQNIYYQGFLKDGDFIILPTSQTNWFSSLLINIRTNVLNILRTNINNPDELSIAEALLIGYRDELDRDLVRAYSNTGVVHIIAISGLHLGMIYGLILFLFKPFNRFKWGKIAKPITIIFVLWMFSLIAGMAPSILRSAIMFTVIAIGEAFNKKSNIHNGLALSAIIILIINPFSLWDVGFQLSYTAVLSIVVFSPYIKNWFYFKNKLLAAFWNLNSITLSAQILTLPVVLYHFHQFPLLFLVTNIFAVPWSGFILYLELLLLVFCWWQPAATFIGKGIEWMIWVMNKFILSIDSLSFAVLEYLQISIPQAIILFAIIICFCYWLINKNKKMFFATLSFVTIFFTLRSIDFIGKYQQKKVIVYNVPNHQAIDIIEGRKYEFIGDSIMNEEGFLKNFHIKPSRTLHRINADALENIYSTNNFIYTKNKIIALVDSPLQKVRNEKIKVDAIVISKNPKLYMNQLTAMFDCKTIIFDGSNPNWKINYWKKDCDSLHIDYHICATQGAYVIDF